MYSPLAMLTFTGVTNPSKWEYTIYQLLAGLWSPDTVCTEEKGNPVISCLKSDSLGGANCTSRHYLIGRRTSYISGSMTSFILPSHLPSGEYFLLSRPFLKAAISAFLFLVILQKGYFLQTECECAWRSPQHWQQVRGCEMTAGGFGKCFGNFAEEAVYKWGGSRCKT